jgi:3-hydroxybutyryl-CoA dehydratase
LLYFEDFSEGQMFESSSKTISSEDVQKFANLTGDFNKLHFERDFAKSAGFDETIVHGLLTLSDSLGLWHSMDLTNGTVLAFAGLSNVTFKAPVYMDDRIRIITRVVGKRVLVSRKNSGLLKIWMRTLNQKDEPVLECELSLIVKTRTNT